MANIPKCGGGFHIRLLPDVNDEVPQPLISENLRTLRILPVAK